MSQTAQKSNGNVYCILGLLFVVLAFLIIPILFMPLAIIFGILYTVNGNNPEIGIMIIILALIFGCFGAALGGWGFGLPKLSL